EAALLLAPERRLTHMTRALLRFQRADAAGMLTDAAALVEEAPEVAAQLRDYARVVFRPYDFAPSALPLATDTEDFTGEIGQSLEAVQWLVGVYVTRLRRLRAAVAGLAGIQPTEAAPVWLPPDLSPLS